jgi:hypothetical protein
MLNAFARSDAVDISVAFENRECISYHVVLRDT